MTEVREFKPPLPPVEWFQPILEPARPSIVATQRDAALVIEEFRSTLGECNADKQFLAEYFMKYFQNE